MSINEQISAEQGLPALSAAAIGEAKGSGLPAFGRPVPGSVRPVGSATGSEELESAIGDPFGYSDLRDKARNFEERWDDKRNQLKDGLSGVKDHAKGVIEGIRDWDSQTATQLSNV